MQRGRRSDQQVVRLTPSYVAPPLPEGVQGFLAFLHKEIADRFVKKCLACRSVYFFFGDKQVPLVD